MARTTRVVGGLTMSLDGFVADRSDDLSPLYPDLEKLRETEFLKESIRDTGAVVMGRRTYDVANGDLTGYEYQVPIFVITHKPPPTMPKGTNERLTVRFVPKGVEEALRLAKAAAKDVTIVGGPDVLSQLVERGLVDVIDVGIVPILLGNGLPMFGSLGRLPPLERIRVLESPGRTDIFYRVKKR